MKHLYVTYLSIAGSVLFIVAITLLHFLQPDMSPWNEAMSYYVHGNKGWLLTIALFGLGIGSLGLAFGLKNILWKKGGKIGIILLFVWSIGIIVGAIFPADPPGHWDQPPSVPGMIHGVVAIFAIISFPFAAILLSRALKRNNSLQIGATLFVLAISSLLCLALFIFSVLPAIISSGPPKLFGLSERVLFVAYILWITVTGYSINKPSKSG